MAVNHADGTLFVSIVMCPIVATYGAFGVGARWALPLFFIAGLAVGLCLVIVSRFVLYSVMDRILSSRLMEDENAWVAWIVGPPLMLAYFTFPLAIIGVGFYMTYFGSISAAGTFGIQ